MAADPVALTSQLVQCPSVTPEEGGALAFLDKTLSAAGFTVHRVTFQEPGSASRNCAGVSQRLMDLRRRKTSTSSGITSSQSIFR